MIQDADLIQFARETAFNSYSPYSYFKVGAAVWADGVVYCGTNVENASYGLTICAERAAIFAAIAGGRKKIGKLAVVCVDLGPDGPDSYRMPCGACRQVMAEFADKDFLCIVEGVGPFGIQTLLPGAFKLA